MDLSLGLHASGTGAGLVDFLGKAFGLGADFGAAEQSLDLLSITALMIEALEVRIIDLASLEIAIWAVAKEVAVWIFFFSISILDFRRVTAEASCWIVETAMDWVISLLLEKLELVLELELKLVLELRDVVMVDDDWVVLEVALAIIVAELTMEDSI